ncbi:MAG: tetratricopeptide repeat protein [Fidelibacterota bacterium]
MKRFTIFIIASMYLLGCGGGREVISDSSDQEEAIARSLIQQDGARPDIDPEALNPKVPPQKIISSSQDAPAVAVVKEKKVQPAAANQDTLSAAALQTVKETASLDTISTTTPDTVQVVKDTVAAPVVKVVKASTAPSQEKASAGGILLPNLTFDDIYFEEKSAMPSSAFNSNYYVTIGKIVKALRSDPVVKVRISGHSDYEGNEQLNYELSEKRATTFAKILVDLFPVEMQTDIARRIEISPESTRDLLVETDNKARRALNRRVSFELFYGELQHNPYAVYMRPPTKTAAAPAPRSGKPSSSIQQKLYDKAMLLFNQKRYNEAIDIFEEILVIDSCHSLADNAHFWMGEAHYYQGRYHEALAEYYKVFGAGDGNKEAAAQMRLGYCYFRLNQLDRAVTEFRKVIENYPDASEEIRRSNLVLSKIRNY